MSEPFLQDSDVTVYVGDALTTLRELDDESVDCCVTSPPYWGLRDYGVEGQLGMEATPAEFVANMVSVFTEVRRVLASHGTLWLNLGDTYAANRTYQVTHTRDQNNDSNRGGMSIPDGLKEKDLIGVPWRVALALQEDGWWLRSDIVWAKPNPIPESVTDRPTRSHEYVFLLSKRAHYYYDSLAVREPAEWRRWGDQTSPKYEDRPGVKGHSIAPRTLSELDLEERRAAGKNLRDVWSIKPQPYADAHFATFPEELVRRCILCGCPKDGVVLDPFAGSGTTLLVARKERRHAIGIELSEEYAREHIAQRLAQQSLFA